MKIFDYKWENIGKSIIVKDPIYGQEHNASIYKVVIDKEECEFACCEFSNGVYGFYIYKY